MEFTVANIISSLLVLLFRSFFRDIDKFLVGVQFFFQNLPKFFPSKWNACSEGQVSNDDSPEEASFTSNMSCNKEICTMELNIVLNGLGIRDESNDTGDNRFSEDDFSALFDEEEPSLLEIKEAFEVFDVNKDGYIDDSELHNVLSNLGLKQRFGLKDCKRMIKVFDDNGDGFIDFYEFVKLLEKCFC